MTRAGSHVRSPEVEATISRLKRELASLRDASAGLEEALLASEARYRTVVELLGGLTYQAESLAGAPSFVHGPVREITGYDADEFVRGAVRWDGIVDPRDLPQLRAEAARLQMDASHVATSTYRIRHRGGSVRWVREVARNVDVDGGPRVVQGTIVDITAEHRLHEQLIQAQRMETVGRLVAGIAHDFNNLLTTIVGYSSLARRALGPDETLAHDLEQVEEAARHAADLTRRLLTFTRRQASEVGPVDLTDVVRGLEKLVRRTVGDDVEVTSRLEAEPWRVRADASLIEQVLLSLVVHARDAMPGGGTLDFETANVALEPSDPRERDEVRPGDFVRLSVRHAGTAIPPDAAGHVSDIETPGADVGLSAGLDVAMQFGGLLRSRREGPATTIELFFPRLPDVPETEAAPAESAAVPRGTEHLLLVEDNATVRGVTARSLEYFGYTVHVAGGGDEALRWARTDPPRPSLVITDLVMPRMSGRQVADGLRDLLGHMPVLFISGYLDGEAASPEAVRDEEFLPKPFTPIALARKVREVLDRARRNA